MSRRVARAAILFGLPLALLVAGEIAARPQVFRIETVHQRPASVQQMYDLAGQAFAYIQEHGKPFCLVLDTYRFSAHSKGDDYRDPGEIAEWKARDPLRQLAEELEPAHRQTIEAEIRARIERAVERASAAEFASAEAITW